MGDFVASKSLFEGVEAKLKELYDWHDFYFCEDPSEKQAMLKGHIEEIDGMVEDIMVKDGSQKNMESNEAKSTAAFLRGKAWNAMEQYQASAEDYLSKAVKLNPTNAMAWLQLGLCFWKKGDKGQARSCMNESITQKVTKEALRELSMLTRQVRRKDEKPEDLSMESIKLAKKAIALDLEDHMSWYVLGNAWCFRFFNISNNLADVKMALVAYKRALDLCGDVNPDLLHNQGECMRYLQDYDSALAAHKRAIEIDPSYSAAKDSVREIEEMVTMTASVLETCAAYEAGKPSPAGNGTFIKRKRYDQVLSSLRTDVNKDNKKSKSSVVATSTGKRVAALGKLTSGVNEDSLLVLKVLSCVTKGGGPECFVCADAEGQLCFLSVYNAGPASAQFGTDAIITVAAPLALLPTETTSGTKVGSVSQSEDKENAADQDQSFDLSDGLGNAGSKAAPSTNTAPSRTFKSLGLPVVQVFDLKTLAFNGRAFSDSSYMRPNVTFETISR